MILKYEFIYFLQLDANIFCRWYAQHLDNVLQKHHVLFCLCNVGLASFGKLANFQHFTIHHKRVNSVPAIALYSVYWWLLFIEGIDDSQQSVVAVRIARPDFITALSTSATDSIILTVTLPSDYPHVAPAVSVSGDSLCRRKAEQLSVALAHEAKQLIGQPMILDKYYVPSTSAFLAWHAICLLCLCYEPDILLSVTLVDCDHIVQQKV